MNDSLSSDIYASTQTHSHSCDSQCNSEGEEEEDST